MIFSFLFVSIGLFAKEIPASPKPPRLVNDYAGALSNGERQALEQKLVAYFDTTSTQIAIVIEQSLDGDDLFDYCQRLAEGWGIGEKDKSNGVLIYVALDDHKIRIHTGYGMEAVLPDALCNQIINNRIKPAFKAGAYYQGLDETTDDIIAAAKGEYSNDREPKGGFGNLLLLFAIIIILIFIFKGKVGGGGRRGFAGPLFWGTFGSGGFSSGGGSSGGGFGGFGGGGFGGGGSSGNW